MPPPRLAARCRRAALAAALGLAAPLGACGDGAGTQAPPPALPAAGPGADRVPAGVAVEVFRLAPTAGGALALTGRVPTPEARAGLLAEVRRRFPGRPVEADLVVDPAAPGSWVPEALALLPFVAEVEGGGLVVEAEPGPAGGGTLSLTGRLPDDAALLRLAADVAATVAPPFVVRTPLLIGTASDEAAADSAGAAPPPLHVEAAPGAEAAARALREALTPGDSGVALTFVPGAATLAPAASAALGRAAAAVAAHPGTRVEVAVGVEATGSPSLDRALALRRGETVRARLAAGGGAQVVVAGEPAAGPGLHLRVQPPVPAPAAPAGADGAPAGTP